MTPIIPTLGRIVHYTLCESDVEVIRKRRAKAESEGFWPGNPVMTGQVFPAMIVQVWVPKPTEDAAVQLQVFLDGFDQHWVSSAVQGIGERQWFAPERSPARDLSEVPIAIPHDGPSSL